jgi:uncharacterized protein (TIGR02246 family)
MSDPCYTTSRDAEQAFYDAFQRANADEMMQLWADDDAIVCVHPMGPRLCGRRAVAQSWEQIFANGTPMRFELAEVRCTVVGDLAVHCVHEKIQHGPRLAQRSLVIATNIYQSGERGWRMIVHHASPGVAPQASTRESHSTLH